MRKKLAKAVTSIAVIAAAAAQLSALTVSAAETQYEAGKYARIYIDTELGNGNQIEKADGYQKSAITVVSPAAEGKSYTEKGKMKVRGNSTGRAEKKPFNIKFDKKQDVLGMGKSKKWCLLANCFDPSLMRNYTAFELARTLGLQYTPDCRFAELWVDGVYKGSYLVTDPIESGSTSIDIDTDAEDFMIEFEAYRDEELVTYVTADDGNLRFAISEPEMPDPDDYKEEEMEQYYADQEAYELRAADISAIVNNVTDTIKNGTYEEMCEVIDMESFVDFYLLNEIMKTCDFGWSSVNFYYTASDGKLHAGPAWDFDLSSGNTNPDYPSLVTDESEIAYTQYFTDFASNSSSDGLYAANYNFYQYLTSNEDFMNEVKQEFLEKQDEIDALISEGGKIDQICDEYRDMFENNYTPVDDGGAGWIASKSYAQTMRIPDDTFAENYAFFKNWMAERNDWLYETWIGHEFDENGICKHCGISSDDCSVAGHTYDGDGCTVCGAERPDANKMLFTHGMIFGKNYDLNGFDYRHINGVKIKFKNELADDFYGAVVLGNYTVSENISRSSCDGNTFEFSFDETALWRAPDTITVYKWSGEDPVIEEIEFTYAEEPEFVVPEGSVVLASSDTYDISEYALGYVTSVTIVLKEEIYNGGGQIVFDNWSSSSFNITRASGRTITVDVSNTSDSFSINLWGDESGIESVIVNHTPAID